MSHLTLPSGVGDARLMTFLREMRDKLVALKEKRSAGGELEERVAALETVVTAEGSGLADRVTALETPGA